MNVRSREEEVNTNLEKTLAGILALLADEREHRIQGDLSPEKTELVLARAGLSNEQIAAAIGKNSDAVRKTITRAKAA
jgi:DNA-directed RNA polymerase specialized sigma24 family protein